MNWPKGLKNRIKNNEPLSNKTTFKIGGPAKFFIQPKGIDELKKLLGSVKASGIPIFLLGAGSNLLVSDNGIRGVVLQLNAADFKKAAFRGNYLTAGSGLMLKKLMDLAAGRGLSGLEFLAGIPGTVGGALAMNAGAWGKNIGDLVEKVKVMDYNNKTKVITGSQINFAYRKSSLARYIILEAVFKLSKGSKEEIKKNISRYLQFRRAMQDNSRPNAGCIFKNPARQSAGRLIDLCGLKGTSIGNACISKRHANFILNRGNARAEEVLQLMDLAGKKVKHKFGITLQPEIKIWR